jgi:hypothetical protein
MVTGHTRTGLIHTHTVAIYQWNATAIVTENATENVIQNAMVVSLLAHVTHRHPMLATRTSFHSHNLQGNIDTSCIATAFYLSTLALVAVKKLSTF